MNTVVDTPVLTRGKSVTLVSYERQKHQGLDGKIVVLDLEPIKIKLLCADDGPEWDREKIERVEQKYRQFLMLNLKHQNATSYQQKTSISFGIHISWTR